MLQLPVLLSLLLLSLLFLPSSISAGSASTTISVSVIVSPSCTFLSSTNLDFGQITVSAPLATTVSRVDFSCTKNTISKVGINDGFNVNTTQRQLRTSSNATIPYNLWQDPAHSVEWRNTDPNRLTFMADTPHQSRSIYGVLQTQSDTQPGLYTDVITVTVEF